MDEHAHEFLGSPCYAGPGYSQSRIGMGKAQVCFQHYTQVVAFIGVRGAHHSAKSLCRISLVVTEPIALSQLTLLAVKSNEVLSLLRSVNHGFVYTLVYGPVKYLSRVSNKTKGFPVQRKEDSDILSLSIAR